MTPADVSTAVAIVFGGLTVVTVVFVALSLVFEIAQSRGSAPVSSSARDRHNLGLLPDEPLVSVVVPGYNEELVLDACVDSILRCGYPNLEIILVDDGSTDATASLMRTWETVHPGIRAVLKPNGGKGSALNAGAAHARGDILLFVDADGIFTVDTIPAMLRAFVGPGVGAVCGNDRPANLDRVMTRFLATISHVGTGMVRRALHVFNCVPVVSGNIGAFRREALDATAVDGQFLRIDTVGEDLELTWRMRLAGWRVAFQPEAVVYAESPSTVKGLWKQRVRWARGLLQSLRIHASSIGSLRHGLFGLFLVFQLVAAITVPVLQIIAIGVTTAALAQGWIPNEALLALTAAATVISGVIAIYGIALDSAFEHLRYLWTIVLWPFYSLTMSATIVRALVAEAARRPNVWNKLDRTGVVSDEATGRMGHSPLSVPAPGRVLTD